MTIPGKSLTIGFAYDSPVDKDTAGAQSVSSEYEDQRTIDWLYRSLDKLGDVVCLPWSKENPVKIAGAGLDVIFNITEAGGGRNRESFVPAIAEALAIPCTGTDAVGLGLSLDKYYSKVIAAHTGIPTPPFIRIDSIGELDDKQPEIERIGYPLFAKPVTGGSSQGIRKSARIESFRSLKDEIEWIFGACQDSALVEKFVSGREFCVGLLETDTLRCFPVAELRLEDGNPEAFYFYDLKSHHQKEVICPAEIPPETTRKMEDYAVKLYNALGCRDLARVDFRQAQDGTVYFLEINPLPGLSPYYSVYTVQAEAGGIGPEKVIEILVRNALARATG